jgi:hypothetical protein
MPRCFVIQPFDAGKFDKRYEQVFKPAIVAAGLEAYRVDQDDRVEIPIEAIETGIREAAVCLADISTDNPNVWYELGYASSANRSVVMVCDSSRDRFPFDIQHRTVIRYQTDAPEDFTALQGKISARLKIAMQKTESLRQIETELVAPVSGLSQSELTFLAILVGEVGTPDGTVSSWSLGNSAEREGLTKAGFALAYRRLLTKLLIEEKMATDHNDHGYVGLAITEKGWQWIDSNEDRFILRRPTLEDLVVGSYDAPPQLPSATDTRVMEALENRSIWDGSRPMTGGGDVAVKADELAVFLALPDDAVHASLDRLEAKGRVVNAGGNLSDPRSRWHTTRRF